MLQYLRRHGDLQLVAQSRKRGGVGDDSRDKHLLLYLLLLIILVLMLVVILLGYLRQTLYLFLLELFL